MPRLRIDGQHPLRGELIVGGAKNAVLKVLAGCLLIEQPVILNNVPRIEDVTRMIEVLHSLGVAIAWEGDHRLRIDAARVDPAGLDQHLVGHFRASALLMGALLGRIGQVSLPGPGGDQIGARSLDAHLEAFRQAGVELTEDGQIYHLRRQPDGPVDVTMSEVSVTATENILLASVLRHGTTTIRCAAADHSVQELCWFLQTAGAKISGVGSSRLVVDGVSRLNGVDGYDIMPDPVEAATFIALGAATRATLDIHPIPLDFLAMELGRFRAAHVHFELSTPHRHHQQPYRLATARLSPSTQLVAINHLHNMPYPGIIPDVLPPMTVMLTQATGTSLVHDWMYEGRLKYVDELKKMGANIFVADPHRILVTGPVPLFGAAIRNNDIRAGASLLIAALLASGTSVLDPVYPLDRGYERLDERLRALGAQIERLGDPSPSRTA